MKSKGNVLQIVLIIFMFFTFSLSTFFNHLVDRSKNNHSIELLDEQRRLEVLLIHYYRVTLEEDILLSDDYENDQIELSYDVEVDGNYIVSTYISTEDYEYSFICEFSIENYDLIKLEYQK